MKRSFPALIAAAAIALSGCATFTDADVAARVGDDEITVDQLSSIAREQLGDDDAGRSDMQTIVGILNNWVLDRVLRADLAAAGMPLDEVEGELSDAVLGESIDASFGTWQQSPPTAIPDDELRDWYERGPTESNLTCTAHILVDDESTADEVLERLDDGDAFGELAAEYSTDTSAENGGALPCSTTTDFAERYIPEYVEAALDADIGDPVGPVESQFGYHVILVRPYDDVAADELLGVISSSPQVRFEVAADELDVYVNPRYGEFDPASGVTPLG
ncbi:MAG: peptidylprolyl isomerase [Ilumatobacteraceae bacterium]|nr:peptidylprolyl isomerase [Ilumatobacteraceae bacterium]